MSVIGYGTTCDRAGGVWRTGEPCRMDAIEGRRCRYHQPGVDGALGAAIIGEMLDPVTTRMRRDYDGNSRAIRETRERLVEIGLLFRSADQGYSPELSTLLTTIRYYTHTLLTLWDITSRPCPAASLALAEQLRQRLAEFADDLGPFLPDAIAEGLYKPYLETTGNLSPYPSQRHSDDCEQPYDELTGQCTCGCPVLYDWEVAEREAADEVDG